MTVKVQNKRDPSIVRIFGNISGVAYEPEKELATLVYDDGLKFISLREWEVICC